MEETLPMRGRMIHGKDRAGELYEKSQDYDIHGRVCSPTQQRLIFTYKLSASMQLIEED
jgi:hypothetical protein